MTLLHRLRLTDNTSSSPGITHFMVPGVPQEHGLFEMSWPQGPLRASPHHGTKPTPERQEWRGCGELYTDSLFGNACARVLSTQVLLPICAGREAGQRICAGRDAGPPARPPGRD